LWGEHNTDVLGGGLELGLIEEELHHLAEHHVIGDRPAGL
jgi:hypothetical protein